MEGLLDPFEAPPPHHCRDLPGAFPAGPRAPAQRQHGKDLRQAAADQGLPGREEGIASAFVPSGGPVQGGPAVSRQPLPRPVRSRGRRRPRDPAPGHRRTAAALAVELSWLRPSTTFVVSSPPRSARLGGACAKGTGVSIETTVV